MRRSVFAMQLNLNRANIINKYDFISTIAMKQLSSGRQAFFGSKLIRTVDQCSTLTTVGSAMLLLFCDLSIADTYMFESYTYLYRF